MKKLINILILASITFSPIVLNAGNTGVNGFNASFYRRMIDGTGGFSVPTSNTLGRQSFHIGLDIDYSMKPLSIVNPARLSTTDLVKNQIMINAGAAFGFTDNIMAGVTIPFAIYQNGTECLDANCSRVRGYSGQALGDVMLGLKWRFLSQPKFPVGLALYGILDLPTGSRKNFLGDGKVDGEIGIALDRRFKKWSLGLSSSYRFINKTQVFRSTYDDYISAGGYISVDLHPKLRLIAEAKGNFMPSRFNSETTEAEFLAGLEYRFGKRSDKHGFKAHLLGGRRIVNGFGAPDARIVAGAGWTSRGKPKKPAGAEPKLGHVVYFMFDKHEMTPRKRLNLRRYTKRIMKRLPSKISIEGHADLWGELEHNESLSKKRAETVRDFLTSVGIPSSIIEISFYGSSKPIYTEMTFKGQKLNRRGEIYIYEE